MVICGNRLVTIDCKTRFATGSDPQTARNPKTFIKFFGSAQGSGCDHLNVFITRNARTNIFKHNLKLEKN